MEPTHITEPFVIRRPGAEVTMVLQVFEDKGTKVCGIYKAAGRINLKPKEWLAAVRQEVAMLEQIALDAGCDEMRLSGRDWSRVLAGMGYEAFPAKRNGLRKVLNGRQ